jgi:hypothetical protein
MVIVSPAFCGASDLAMRLIYYHVTTPTWTAGCRAFTLNKTHPSDLRPEIILFFVPQIVTVICLTISVSFLSSDVEDENGNDGRVYLWDNYLDEGESGQWPHPIYLPKRDQVVVQ